MKKFKLTIAGMMLAMFLGGYSTATAQNYDLNGDGAVDVADMSALINYMAGSRQAPVIMNRVQADAAKAKLNETGAQAIDLGLPSGRRWADRNIGYSKDIVFGVYFAWGGLNWVAANGENVPNGYVLEKGTSYDAKETAFNWKNYEHIAPGRFTWRGICKYTIADGVMNEGTDEVYWYDADRNFNGDNIRKLEDGDDAATYHWGAKWRMPLSDEFQELLDHTEQTWKEAKMPGSDKAVWGCEFKGPNGNTIFLPAAGDVEYQYVEYRIGQYIFPRGKYWAKDLDSHFGHDSSQANMLSINRQVCCEDEPNNMVSYYERQYGLSIRPVLADQ